MITRYVQIGQMHTINRKIYNILTEHFINYKLRGWHGGTAGRVATSTLCVGSLWVLHFPPTSQKNMDR